MRHGKPLVTCARAPLCLAHCGAGVTDGDTLRCADGTRVRLLSIDAPEIAQVPHGKAARVELESITGVGDTVQLETDLEVQDQFGRMLAYVYDDGVMVNEEMARRGYVVLLVYAPNTRWADRIGAAVDDARRSGRGLWRTNAFDCLPVDFRAGRCR
jgi:micrococcal nuclease